MPSAQKCCKTKNRVYGSLNIFASGHSPGFFFSAVVGLPYSCAVAVCYHLQLKPRHHQQCNKADTCSTFNIRPIDAILYTKLLHDKITLLHCLHLRNNFQIMREVLMAFIHTLTDCSRSAFNKAKIAGDNTCNGV